MSEGRIYRSCFLKECKEEVQKKFHQIRSLDLEGLAPYKVSWIVGNSFSLEQKKIDPEDKSIEELMTDKNSWIFKGNKPARICSQILLRLSVLSSKKIYHGNLSKSTIYFNDESLYLMNWGIECLTRIGNSSDPCLLQKDINDFKTFAISFLEDSQNKRKSHIDFLEILKRDDVTLEDLQNTDFIEEIRFPLFKEQYERMRESGWMDIGSGTFGNVTKINCGGHPFAIKKINSQDLSTAKREAMIFKKASEACKYIVKYYEFWTEENGDSRDFYIKMECCKKELENLSNVLMDERYSYIKQLLIGVKSLHENGIAHGDLKLNNIFIEDTIKIGDFGTSRSCSDMDNLSIMKNDLRDLSYIIYYIRTNRIQSGEEGDFSGLSPDEPVKKIVDTLYHESKEGKSVESIVSSIDGILTEFDDFFKKYEFRSELKKSLHKDNYRNSVIDKLFKYNEEHGTNFNPEIAPPISYDHLSLGELEKYVACLEKVMEVHCVEELEYFPFDRKEQFDVANFITKNREYHNFRNSADSYFIEYIEEHRKESPRKEEQNMRYYSIIPSYNQEIAQFYTDAQYQTTTDPENQDILNLVYVNSVSLKKESISITESNDSTSSCDDAKISEEKIFHLFETLLTLKDCIMTTDPSSLTFTLKEFAEEPEDGICEYIEGSKYKDLIPNLKLHFIEKDDIIQEEIHFEAHINGKLVATGSKLTEDETSLTFWFKIFVNSLPGITDKMSYIHYAILSRDKKVTINMPSKQNTWLEHAETFWEKHIRAEMVLCNPTTKIPFIDEEKYATKINNTLTDKLELKKEFKEEEEEESSDEDEDEDDDDDDDENISEDDYNDDDDESISEDDDNDESISEDDYNDDDTTEEKKEDDTDSYFYNKKASIQRKAILNEVEKETADSRRCAISKRVDKFEVLMDPHKELDKAKAIKQVEEKWKHLYPREVSIVVTWKPASEVPKFLYRDSLRPEIISKEATRNVVIIVAYPVKKDGERDFETPTFFLWINHKREYKKKGKKKGRNSRFINRSK